MYQLADLYPLTPLQSMFFAVGGGPDDVGHLQFRVALRGELDASAFERAWRDLVDATPILRTAFVSEGLEQPLQVVFDSVELPFEYRDARDLPPGERQACVDGLAARDVERGFALDVAPLMRLALVRTAERDYVLLFSHHHLLLDGWSLDLAFREASERYSAIRAGRRFHGARRGEYRDFVAWLAAQDRGAAADFWRRTLAGMTQPPLLAGGGVAGSPSEDYGERHLTFGAGLSTRLRELARRSEVTVATLVRGAWALALCRATGSDDVVFGATVSGRPPDLDGAESIVGLFINNVPVRVRVDRRASVGDWLREIRDAQTEGTAFEYASLAQIHEWSEVPPHRRLFDSLVVFQNNSINEFTEERFGGDIEIAGVQGRVRTSYPVTVVAALAPDLAVWLKYYRSRVDDAMADSLLGALDSACRALAVSPERPVGEALGEVADVSAGRGGGEARDAGCDLPSDALEARLAAIWARHLGVPSVGVHGNFFDLGGHSLLAVSIFADVEATLGVRLPLASLLRAPTVAELAAELRRGGCAAEWASLVPIQTAGTRTPLFCVHAAGGHVLFYRDLALRLGPDQPVYGLQPRGLDGRSPRDATVPDMAAHYIEEIRQVRPRGPYLLGGSSYGGTIAVEMARQLADRGEEVGLVALFDTYGPGYPKRRASTTRLHAAVYGLYDLIYHHVESLVLLAPGRRREYLDAKAAKVRSRVKRAWRRWKRAAGRFAHQIAGRPLPSELRETQNVIASAHEAHRLEAYNGRLTLFRATHQPRGIHPDPTLGWGPIAAGGLEIFEVPGSHGSIVVEPRVGRVAAILAECMERAVADSRPGDGSATRERALVEAAAGSPAARELSGISS